MARKRRIPKTPERRLEECEMQLYFLWDERQLQDSARLYKNIATQLRVLVGDQKPSRRLLTAMMKEYGFAYDVHPDESLDKVLIPMHWRDIPEEQAERERKLDSRIHRSLQSRFRSWSIKAWPCISDHMSTAIETSYLEWLNRSAVVTKISR